MKLRPLTLNRRTIATSLVAAGASAAVALTTVRRPRTAPGAPPPPGATTHNIVEDVAPSGIARLTCLACLALDRESVLLRNPEASDLRWRQERHAFRRIHSNSAG